MISHIADVTIRTEAVTPHTTVLTAKITAITAHTAVSAIHEAAITAPTEIVIAYVHPFEPGVSPV